MFVDDYLTNSAGSNMAVHLNCYFMIAITIRWLLTIYMERRIVLVLGLVRSCPRRRAGSPLYRYQIVSNEFLSCFPLIVAYI